MIRWTRYHDPDTGYYAEGTDGAGHSYQIKADNSNWYMLRCNRGLGWRNVGLFATVAKAKDAASSRSATVNENPISVTQWALIYAGVVGVGVVAYELLKKPAATTGSVAGLPQGLGAPSGSWGTPSASPPAEFNTSSIISNVEYGCSAASPAMVDIQIVILGTGNAWATQFANDAQDYNLTAWYKWNGSPGRDARQLPLPPPLLPRQHVVCMPVLMSSRSASSGGSGVYAGGGGFNPVTHRGPAPPQRNM